MGHPPGWRELLGLFIDLAAWYALRNLDGDDDRWRRRGRRVLERVAEVAGRLRVVPEPT